MYEKSQNYKLSLSRLNIYIIWSKEVKLMIFARIGSYAFIEKGGYVPKVASSRSSLLIGSTHKMTEMIGWFSLSCLNYKIKLVNLNKCQRSEPP